MSDLISEVRLGLEEQRSYSLPQRVPAVDHQGRAGHVARGVAGQVHRERPEILRLAEIAQRDVGAGSFDHLRMNLGPALVRLRHEAARQDGVDRDLVDRPVGRHGAGELQHRPLRRFVVPSRDASPGDQGIDRCDVDDPSPLAPLDHRRAEPPRAEHAAGEIQVDQLTPLVERHRFRGDVLAPAAHVVDENVDRGVSFQGRLTRLLAFGGLADVGRDGPGLPAEGANVAGRLLQAGLIAADEDHVGPRVGDRDRHFPPQPATAAGDEETLSRQFESVKDAHDVARLPCESPGQGRLTERVASPANSPRLRRYAARSWISPSVKLLSSPTGIGETSGRLHFLDVRRLTSVDRPGSNMSSITLSESPKRLPTLPVTTFPSFVAIETAAYWSLITLSARRSPPAGRGRRTGRRPRSGRGRRPRPPDRSGGRRRRRPRHRAGGPAPGRAAHSARAPRWAATRRPSTP